ncbi:MAG: hypothetical protein ACOC4F_02480 [bacterium]
MNLFLRVPACSFALFLMPAVLSAMEVTPSDSEFTLVREARPWLQDLDEDGLLRSFDIVASESDEGLEMRAGDLEMTLSPDSLLLPTQLTPDGTRLRLLYGTLDVRAADTTQPVVLEPGTGDISLELSGVHAEVRVSHGGGVLLVVREGTAAVRRGTPEEDNGGRDEAFANVRRALHYDPAQDLFTAIPTAAPGVPDGSGDRTSARGDMLRELEDGIDRFNERYATARVYRDLFDEAFERDRAGLPTDDLRDELGSSGSDAVMQALEAGYRVFPLLRAVLGAETVRNALVRRLVDEPETDAPRIESEASEQRRVALESISVFVERFSELAYQARIARLFATVPSDSP